jgi:hypothetical protein
MDVLLAGNVILPIRGHFAGYDVQRHLPVETFRGSRTPFRACRKVFSFNPEWCSLSSRNSVQNQPGMLFSFITEWCSASPGFPKMDSAVAKVRKKATCPGLGDERSCILDSANRAKLSGTLGGCGIGLMRCPRWELAIGRGRNGDHKESTDRAEG